MTICLQSNEKLLLELNRNVCVVENSKLSSPLLVTTGTAVASDKNHDVRVCLISKKWTNIQEASDYSMAPNAAKAISGEAWNSPVKYPIWEHKSDKR